MTRGSSGGGGSKQRTARGGAKGASKAKVRRPATIEGEIETLDAEVAKLNEQMLDPDVYTDPSKSAECLDRLAQLDRDLAARWKELETSHEVYG